MHDQEPHPASAAASEYGRPAPAGVFDLGVLTDNELIELNNVLTTAYVTGDHLERDEAALERVNSRLTADVEAFAARDPDRATVLLQRVAFDPSSNEADLYLAMDLAKGLWTANQAAAFDGLLAAAYGNHYRKDGSAFATSYDAQMILWDLRDHNRLTDPQLAELQRRADAWTPEQGQPT